MPVGADGSAEFANPGTVGGVKTVTLANAHMPSHSHGGQTGYTGPSDRSLGHQHSCNSNTGGRSTGHYHGDYYGGWDYVIQTGSGGGTIGFGMVGGDRSISQVNVTGADDRDHTHGISFWSDGQGAPDHLHQPSGIAADGGSQPHSVLNPYIAVTFIIKT
jgi:microcystin-dependent protein